jgi:hypothetical protein
MVSVAAVVAPAALASLSACGASQSNGRSDSGASSTGAGSDSGADAIVASGPDGSAAGDGGGCQGDLSSVASVTETFSSAAAPTLTGGAIQDGTYMLTSYTAYGTAACAGMAPTSKGLLSVTSGAGRLELQDQGNTEQCPAGPFQDGLFTGTSTAGDASSTIVVLYGVSSDGLTVYLIPGTGDCPGVATGMTVYTFVHQ